MKEYSFTIGICFLVLCGFAQNDNWSRPAHKTPVQKTLNDTAEKTNNTDNLSDSKNTIPAEKNNSQFIRQPHIIQKTQPDLPNTTSTKTDVSGSAKQDNKVMYIRPIRQALKPQ